MSNRKLKKTKVQKEKADRTFHSTRYYGDERVVFLYMYKVS
jgi:hypothetical protein